MLSFNAALLVTEQQIGPETATTKVRPIQPRVVVKTASKWRCADPSASKLNGPQAGISPPLAEVAARIR